MKNIKTFESYGYEITDMGDQTPIKNYGDPFPLSNLTAGDKVTYLGSPFVVDMADEYLAILRSENGTTVRVNQNMFNQKGYIRRDNVPAKMM
jgi:hypothetical protein